MAVTAESWLQAQYSVLGAVLIDSGTVGPVIQDTTEDDYSGPCKTVFQAIKRIFVSGQTVDVVSVANALGQQYYDFLKQLMEITPSAAGIHGYISICRSQARVLALQNLGRKLADAANEDETREIMAQANAILVERQSTKVYSMAEMLHAFSNRALVEKVYTRWPIAELNERLFTEQGDFVILGGYPSAGKSAFALQCAAMWARNKRVGFYSLETSQDKLFDRFMAAYQDLSLSDIKQNALKDADWASIAQHSGDITSLQLEVIPAAGMTTADIKAAALSRRHEVIIIDYLQLIRGSGNNRYEQVTNISMELHTMAQSMGVLILALSQLKRSGQSSDAAPTMTDLRESGQLEQDADLIMLLYLDKDEKADGIRILRIAKNKEGTRPAIRLDFDGPHQRFSKADSTGSVAAHYAAQGRAARRNRREPEQMSLLPPDTPVPF